MTHFCPWWSFLILPMLPFQVFAWFLGCHLHLKWWVDQSKSLTILMSSLSILKLCISSVVMTFVFLIFKCSHHWKFLLLHSSEVSSTSSQDRCVSIHASPPCTTIKNYNQISKKKNNNWNHQKIELYGSLTTNDLKKSHSSRWEEGVESWSQGGEDTVWHGETAEWMVPHSHVVDKNWEGYLGSEPSQPQARLHSPSFQQWEDKLPLPLTLKTSGGWGGRRGGWIFAT